MLRGRTAQSATASSLLINCVVVLRRLIPLLCSLFLRTCVVVVLYFAFRSVVRIMFHRSKALTTCTCSDCVASYGSLGKRMMETQLLLHTIHTQPSTTSDDFFQQSDSVDSADALADQIFRLAIENDGVPLPVRRDPL